jgi:hypothetical protein
MYSARKNDYETTGTNSGPAKASLNPTISINPMFKTGGSGKNILNNLKALETSKAFKAFEIAPNKDKEDEKKYVDPPLPVLNT